MDVVGIYDLNRSSGHDQTNKGKFKYIHGLVIAFVFICLFSLIVLAGLYFFYTYRKDSHFVGSYVYTVPRYENNDEAALILSDLNSIARKVINRIEYKYDPPNKFIKLAIKNLKRYKFDKLSENDPTWAMKHKALTTSDGRIYMTLRKKDGSFYDSQILRFVFLHELAHVGTDKRYMKKDDHSREYWAVFKLLLINANELNLIHPIPYGSKITDTYAGTKISYNPYYDKSLSELLMPMYDINTEQSYNYTK